MEKIKNIIWYKKPATEWLEALPIGNGRIGVMVFGGIGSEKLALSESTVWSGRDESANDNPRGPIYLPLIQQELLKIDRNSAIINNLMEKYQGKMDNFGTSRPFGNLTLDFCAKNVQVTDYKRSLDLDTAIATTEYVSDDVFYKREIFASYPDQVVAMKIFSSKNDSIEFCIKLEPVAHNGGAGNLETDGMQMLYNGKVYDGEMHTHARIAVITEDGFVLTDKNGLFKIHSKEVVLYISMATTYHDNDPFIQCSDNVKAAIDKGYEKLRNRHIEDFSSLMSLLQIELGDTGNNKLPLDERLAAIRAGAMDPGLDSLWYQYSRYLNISSSRKSSPLPMHLQGIWNDNMAANMCWNCDFHIDINIQMNQWLSTTGNLPEGNLALGYFIKNILMPSGKRTASVQYGKNGWVTHTVTNAWGYSSFVNAIWSIFPTAGAWIASSLWDQFEFYRDEEFLRETAYPVLKDAAMFFLDFLIKDPTTGYLVTAPACSPENGDVSVMPTCDRIILYGLFDSVIKASEILNIDEALRMDVLNAMSKLPPLKISSYGQLKEWYEDSEKDGVTGHRHFSHLLALYPYDQITLEETLELSVAAELSMDRRTKTDGWEETEFTGANLAAFYARLKKGDLAYSRINIVKQKLTSDNLFTISPAGIAGAETDIFIIDGNMGIAAAMSEMLLQSHKQRLEFLPAIPEQWGDGFINGILCRGGFEIHMMWKNFVLVNLVIISKKGNKCSLVKNKALHFGDFSIYQIEKDEMLYVECYENNKKTISFETKEQMKYRLKFNDFNEKQ